jgi:integrase
MIKNTAVDITLPKIIKKEIRVFTVEEQKHFMEEAKAVYAGEIFIFDLGTGLRIGELLSMTWSDVNFDDEIIRVKRTLNIVKDFDDMEAKWHKEFGSPKTESSNRSIPLLPDLVTLLKKVQQVQNELVSFAGSAYENNNLVFATKLGRPLDPRNMQRTFKTITDKAGIFGATIHSCRHTFATRGLENGIELRVMQELLGHASIKMTADLYTHVLPDKKRDSIMKLSGTIKI